VAFRNIHLEPGSEEVILLLLDRGADAHAQTRQASYSLLKAYIISNACASHKRHQIHAMRNCTSLFRPPYALASLEFRVNIFGLRPRVVAGAAICLYLARERMPLSIVAPNLSMPPTARRATSPPLSPRTARRIQCLGPQTQTAPGTSGPGGGPSGPYRLRPRFIF